MNEPTGHPHSPSGLAATWFAQSVTLRISIVAALAAAAVAGVVAVLLVVLNDAKFKRHGSYISRAFASTAVEVIKTVTESTHTTLSQFGRVLEQSEDRPFPLHVVASKVGSLGDRALQISLHDQTGALIDEATGRPGSSPNIDLVTVAPYLLARQSKGGIFYQPRTASSAHELHILAGVTFDSNKLLVGTLGIDAVARHIESIYAGQILITSNTGELIFGDSRLLSNAVLQTHSLTTSYRVFDDAGVFYEAITAPVQDLTGRNFGTIHLIRQDEGSIATERLLERLVTIAFGLALIIFIAAMHALFRSELSPLAKLERLVHDLSRNDLHAPAIKVSRLDEVGRLNHSVETLRQAAIERDRLAFASAAASSLERALIESELRKLSEMLSSDEQQEIAEMLVQVQANDSPSHASGEGFANRSLTQAFRFMSERVRAQQERVTSLLAERTADLEIVRQSLAERSDLFRLREEMSVARSLQLGMLPDPNSLAAAQDQIELQAVMRPAKEVGGDSYDFQLLDSGRRLIFLVCDSSGKGVPAAMFVLTSRSLATAASAAIGRLDVGLNVANAALARTNEALAFTTMFIGSLDLITGVLTYSNAGHNPPVLMRASGEQQRLDQAVGLVLGAMEDVEYEEGRIQLQSGDTLILYTDGVTEAHDSHGAMFGLDRLETACSAIRFDPPALMIERLLKQVDEFAGDTTQYDDITLMALRYTPKALQADTEAG
jgi:serine phosphatase RsbU (regulator of sigma subunit)